MTIQLADRATLKSAKIDDRTGYLKADAVFSRVGIQEYYAHELGLQDRPKDSIVRVYRPPEEVGAAKALDGLKSIPTTDDHPSEDVGPTNWRRLATGWTGENITFDGKLTAGSLVITDHAAILKWNNGKKELSVGYGCDIELKSGTTPEGEAYDAIQRNINPNHVAQVDAGRCGGECRIVDANKCSDCGQTPKTGASCNCHRSDDMSGENAPKLVTRTVDGLSIQVTEQGAQVIDKLERSLADANGKVTAAEARVTELETAHKAEIEKKDGEITGLKTQIPDAAALDRMATERAGMIADVKAVMGSDYDPTGKTNLQMITDAVGKKLGADGVKDKSEEFLRGVFATMKTTQDTSDDSIANVVRDGPPAHHVQQQQSKDGKQLRGRDAYLARLQAGPQLQTAK